MVVPHCSVSDEATVSDFCPSSEWQEIDTFLRLSSNSVSSNYVEAGLAKKIPPAAIEFTGNSAVRQLDSALFATSDPLGKSTEPIIIIKSTTQMSAVADALINTAAFWLNALPFARSTRLGVPPFDEQTAVHVIKDGYYQPYGVSNCVLDAIIAQNDSRPVAFPVITPSMYNPVPSNLQNATDYIEGVPVLEYEPLKRLELLDINGSDSDYRTSWFELPPSSFNLSSLGVVVLLPHQYGSLISNTSQKMIVCNLGAGWGSSSINITYTGTGLGATSSLVNVDISDHVDQTTEIDTGNGTKTPINRYQAITNVALAYAPPFFPRTVIDIQKDWAEFLNPQIPRLNTTVIDYMMKYNTHNMTIARPDSLAQYVLGFLLTNGLARVGGNSRFQGTPKLTPGPNGTTNLDGTFWTSGRGDFFTVNPEQGKDWVKLQVDSTIEGYAYNTRGVGPKAAIAFLLAYCTLATAYTIYAGLTGLLSSDPSGVRLDH